AQRICLTERYLGHIISKTSGVTAKEWIDRALIMRIKVELIHTDKSVACIADEMNFPGPSFFCKYFKRMVGVTPGEYRARNC
ncbi:MAG: helix-turn-helix domain-containing protein, partial [Bacteroidaceae bacterium]